MPVAGKHTDTRPMTCTTLIPPTAPCFGQPLKVWLIDDDEGTQRQLGECFAAFNIQLLIMSQLTAIPALAQNARPHCLIVNTELVGANGIQVMDKLRLAGLACPVIVTARQSSVNLAVKAMQANAVDFVEKPYDPHTMANLIINYCNP